MGKFHLKKGKDGQFYFSLKAGNGEIIGTSEGYKQKASALNGIESIRKNSQDEARFERKEGANGTFRFNLKATNGQVILTSQSYKTESGRDNGIQSVAKNAADATLEDVSDSSQAA